MIVIGVQGDQVGVVIPGRKLAADITAPFAPGDLGVVFLQGNSVERQELVVPDSVAVSGMSIAPFLVLPLDFLGIVLPVFGGAGLLLVGASPALAAPGLADDIDAASASPAVGGSGLGIDIDQVVLSNKAPHAAPGHLTVFLCLALVPDADRPADRACGLAHPLVDIRQPVNAL